MLPEPDCKAEDQLGFRARTSGPGNNNNNDDKGGAVKSWMFRVKSNHEDAKKCAPKKEDHKKKPDV